MLRRRSDIERIAPALALLAATIAVGSTGCQMAAMGQNANGARLYRQGNFQAAMQEFQKASSSDPNNADAQYNMAATLHRLGSSQGDKAILTQAESLYNRCLDLSPDHADCHRGLAVLLVETERQDRAFALLKNWAARNETKADPRIELARLYEEFGDSDTASQHLYQALQIEPNNTRALLALAVQREKAGDLNQALANYSRAYSLNHFQPQVAERMASLQRSISGGGSVSPTNPAAAGTRTVTVPVPTATTPRY